MSTQMPSPPPPPAAAAESDHLSQQASTMESSPMPLPAFSFPASPLDSSSIPSCSILSASTSTSRKPHQRHQRSTNVVSTHKRPQSSLNRHAQFFPPVPALPTNLSSLSPPILRHPTPKSKPPPLRLHFYDESAASSEIATHHLDTLLASPAFSCQAVSPTHPATTTTLHYQNHNLHPASATSFCPSLVPDSPLSPGLSFSVITPPPLSTSFSTTTEDSLLSHMDHRKRANRHAYIIPTSTSDRASSVPHLELHSHPDDSLEPELSIEDYEHEHDADNVDAEVEAEEEDDGEFWSCIGSSHGGKVARTAEWIDNCSVIAADEESSIDSHGTGDIEDLEILDGGWLRAA